MAPPRPIHSFPELLEALIQAQVVFDADPVRQTADIDTEAKGLPGRLHVRWELIYPIVQIIQPMILDVPEARTQAVEAAMARINSVAQVAGLALDYATRTLVFRITAAILVDGVRLDLLQACLHGAVRSALELLPAMQKVIAGAHGEDVLGFLPVPS